MAKSTLLIGLLCSPLFEASLWGRRFTCGEGKVFISSDGKVKEPPAIAAELLTFKPEVEGKPHQVFTFATPADKENLENYLHEQTRNGADGKATGSRVVVHCSEYAGRKFRTTENARVVFDSGGRAVMTEATYQDIRPAFAGDGTNPDQDAPQLTFVGRLDELNDALDQAKAAAPASAPVLDTDDDEDEEEEGEDEENDYNELEPDTDGMGEQAPTAAALEIAAFNAAPAVPLAPAPATPQSPADLKAPVDQDDAEQNADDQDANQQEDVAVTQQEQGGEPPKANKRRSGNSKKTTATAEAQTVTTENQQAAQDTPVA